MYIIYVSYFLLIDSYYLRFPVKYYLTSLYLIIMCDLFDKIVFTNCTLAVHYILLFVVFRAVASVFSFFYLVSFRILSFLVLLLLIIISAFDP